VPAVALGSPFEALEGASKLNPVVGAGAAVAPAGVKLNPLLELDADGLATVPVETEGVWKLKFPVELNDSCEAVAGAGVLDFVLDSGGEKENEPL